MADVQKIELATEELDVTKTVTEAETVRVSVHVETENHKIEIPAAQEDITIETVELGHEVEQVPTVRTIGNVTIIPVVEEEAVVVKRLILRREIRLTKNRTETTRVETVPLRSEHAVIERFSSPNPDPSSIDQDQEL